ncbi:nitrate regulatory gene2 protein [Prosopis cineraria]|uniref:nitrate regulatory gene2 protein n=1 Tax=Prosopis cineraria TaxID=364024 RepID=UPI00241039FB|nr:nitrate regulatory gene2 protein [Prosopis cineraria]
MGCAQSKIDNEESVARCKERKNLMKDVVVARNAFAAGHSGYAMALKNTGAALSDYGHGESHITQELHEPPLDTASEPPPPPPPLMEDNLPPPPPPLPNFSPSPPLKRAATMPVVTMQHQKPSRAMDSDAIAEEGEGEEENIKVNKGNGGKALKKGGSEAASSFPLRTPDMKSVPPMPESKGMAWDYFFLPDNMLGPSLGGEDEIGNENEESEAMDYHEAENVGGGRSNINEVEPKTPEKVEENVQKEIVESVKDPKHIEHSKTAPPDFRRAMKLVPSVNLMQILSELDDNFLKAFESAQEVTRMLEATRLHYHSNFADNRGHIDHSARVMRVITWNRSFRGVSNGDGSKDDFDSEDYETHATVLDKLLAWEKKLYEEVKQAELMKFEYQRKVTLLNKQKKRNASAESLEKTKAAVSHLHTRYIVDMQSMDSTVSEVNHIRDAQLYPKLVALVNGMADMWKNMCVHHDNQLKIVTDMKSLDISQAPKETTKHHYERTVQLSNVVQEWHLQFEKFVAHQKQYIQALNSWLKLNLIPIESSLKEKISSPPKAQNPPIQALLQAWHDCVDRLPDELAKSAISSFAAVIKTIILQQEEEMKLKEKCEETRKEYLRKNQAFEEWYQKYLLRRGHDEADHERGDEVTTNNPVSEKQFAVDSLKKKLEEDIESHQKHCVQVREKSLQSLKTRLPELFRALSDYAHACADSYEKLKSIAHSQVGAPRP